MPTAAQQSDKRLLLTTQNLSIGYGKPLVSAMNIEVRAGEIISLLGPSGIGKTTLLRTIAGLVSPLAGEIKSKVAKRGGIGYIPQRLGLTRHASVAHNVELGAKVGLPWALPFKRAERDQRVLSAIKSMGLEEKMREPVRRLSGGQQRRVATARTLAQRPNLILADEFLGELDATNVALVLDAVNRLVAQGSAMIMVEHHEERAREIADRIWRIVDGKLLEEVVEVAVEKVVE
jgi:ABC-type multidrug transport system ATPase subunit